MAVALLATSCAAGSGGGGPERDDDWTPEHDGEDCDVSETYDAAPRPTDLLFLLDRSGSMHIRIDALHTRWTATRDGLFALIDGLPAVTRAGLDMFPRGDLPVTCIFINASNEVDWSACAPGELPGPEARCDAAVYAQPAVAPASLDDAQQKAIQAFVADSDDDYYWGTPLAPALSGAVQYMSAAAGAVRSVVLLTDGDPAACTTDEDPAANDIQRVIDAAAKGVAFDPPVRTFVLGVVDGDEAANIESLSKVASAGGTARYPGCEAQHDCAYSVHTANFAAELAIALDAIALEAIGCVFPLPDVGQSFDDGAITVTVTQEGDTTVVPHDPDHASGWDYLPDGDHIQLHGETCAQLAKDAQVTIDIALGCGTPDIPS